MPHTQIPARSTFNADVYADVEHIKLAQAILNGAEPVISYDQVRGMLQAGARVIAAQDAAIKELQSALMMAARGRPC